MKNSVAVAAALVLLAVGLTIASWEWLTTERVPYRLDAEYSGSELYEFTLEGQGIIEPTAPRDLLGLHASPRWSTDNLDGAASLWDAETGYEVWRVVARDQRWLMSFWTPDGKAVGALTTNAHPGYYPPGKPTPREAVDRNDPEFPPDQVAPSAPWIARGITAAQWWTQVEPARVSR